MNRFEEHVHRHGTLPATSDGIPIFYIFTSGNVYCAECASEHPENIADEHMHVVGPSVSCMACTDEIKSKVGEWTK